MKVSLYGHQLALGGRYSYNELSTNGVREFYLIIKSYEYEGSDRKKSHIRNFEKLYKRIAKKENCCEDRIFILGNYPYKENRRKKTLLLIFYYKIRDYCPKYRHFFAMVNSIHPIIRNAIS
jgi:hypothetical protein